MEFHRRVAEAANNPVLNIVVNAVNESIRDAISRSKRSTEMRARVVGYHRSILEALQSGNAIRARAIMSEYVVDVQCHIETVDED
jgi:DNA-binding FadR family transcriptional regulator